MRGVTFSDKQTTPTLGVIIANQLLRGMPPFRIAGHIY